MAKLTIDTLPKTAVQYLQEMPQTLDGVTAQLPQSIRSLRIEKSIVDSELEKLVGRFFSHQSFALFPEPEEISCSNTFSQAMLPSISLEEVLRKLRDLKMETMHEQEELEILEASFSKVYELENLYQKILAELKKFQKG